LKNDNRNILCKIVKCTPEEAVIIEVDENLERNDVTDYEERGKMLLERKKAYGRLHPEIKAGGGRTSEKSNSAARNNAFIIDTSKKTGLSQSKIYEDLQVGSIPQEVKDQPFYDDLNKKEKLQLASNLVKEEKKRDVKKNRRNGKQRIDN